MTMWDALRAGLDAFIGRMPLLLGAWLLILGCQQAIDLLVPDTYGWIEVLITMIALAPLYAGQRLLALKAVRREPAVFADLFVGLRHWGPILGANLLVGSLMLLGFVAFIVPGIIVGVMYSFVMIRLLDSRDGERRVRVTEAMAESAKYTRGYRTTIFGVGFVLVMPYVVLGMLMAMSAHIAPWILELVVLLSGTLFLGPVQATSVMAVYDHALKHPYP